MTHEPIELQINYSERLEASIQDGETHFRGTISIRIGDEYIAGGDRAPVADNIHVSLAQLLAGVRACVDGERFHYQTGDGPTYVVLEPTGESVAVTHCKTKSCVEDTGSRLDIEHQGTVLKDSFYRSVLSTTAEFINHVCFLNPDLANSNSIEELETTLQGTKQVVQD